MAIQTIKLEPERVLDIDTSDNVTINQNSVVPFTSIAAGAVANTLYLKEGKVGIGTNTSAAKLEIEVPVTGNVTGLLLNQLDTTNNPIVQEINNDGTNHGLYIHQDGVSASSKYGLYIYSNAAQVNSPLAYIHNDNSSSSGYGRCAHIVQDGTGNAILIDFNDGPSSASGGTAMLINNNGVGLGFVINQKGALVNSAKHALHVKSDALQIQGSLIKFETINASSTADLSELDNDGTGNGLYLHQDGNLATGKYVLYLQNIGTPVDGAGRCIRLDGCTINSTKNPETDAEAGFIGVNIDGTQMAIPYYALS